VKNGTVLLKLDIIKSFLVGGWYNYISSFKDIAHKYFLIYIKGLQQKLLVLFKRVFQFVQLLVAEKIFCEQYRLFLLFFDQTALDGLGPTVFQFRSTIKTENC